MLTDFQNYFSVRIRKMCNNTITKDPTTPQVCRYTRQVTTCLLSQLLSKVTHMLQFLHQMFNLFALLRDDLLKPATLLTNGAIDETLQQFVPLIDDCLLQLVDCIESSTLINHLLKFIQNSAIDWI